MTNALTGIESGVENAAKFNTLQERLDWIDTAA